MQGPTRTDRKGKRLPYKFIVGVESRVYGCDPGTKQQSSQWKNHPPAIQESWGRWSQTSRACYLFSWTERQFFRRSFFLQCQPVNQQFCIGVLRVLWTFELNGENPGGVLSELCTTKWVWYKVLFWWH